MRFRCTLAILLTLLFCAGSVGSATEHFVGPFAEPVDGGNLDTARSSYDGNKVVIVPRAHPSEAVNGSVRWRNLLFAIRGMKGKSPEFDLPLVSPGTGQRVLLPDAVSVGNIRLVWSYEPDSSDWHAFDTHSKTGTGPSTWCVQAQNTRRFEQDVVYVSINERLPVTRFYEWLESTVFVHPFVKPTPSEAQPGTFIIGYQSGAPASAACSRAIPDMPLYAFMLKDPAAHPKKLVMLFSGQHPYEGQNKVALEAAIDWMLNSSSAEAKAYRAQYLTVIYPFVNPTGELAGLWRGTAAAPSKDTNRNWDTLETVPSREPGIDTVIVHKNALNTDIAALGLGEPYAVFDYHQNFGDHAAEPDYVLHSSVDESAHRPAAQKFARQTFAPFFARLTAADVLADTPSDLGSQETLRGYMVARGVRLPVTFERSVYHTLTSERLFGISTVKALVEPASVEVMPLKEASQLAQATASPAATSSSVEE